MYLQIFVILGKKCRIILKQILLTNVNCAKLLLICFILQLYTVQVFHIFLNSSLNLRLPLIRNVSAII